MRVVVPFAAERPKSRLEGVLAPAERRAFARAMLGDVLEAVAATGHRPELLATAPIEIDERIERAVGEAIGDDSITHDPATQEPTADRTTPSNGTSNDAAIPVVVDERPLTEAVNARLAAGTEPIAVVMADLALATPTALSKLFDRGNDAGVVLAPGRGGGTNALVAHDLSFRVDYHGASYRDHRQIAEKQGVSVASVDSYRLGTDIDEPADLAEVLLHASGAAREWLVAAGFALAVEDGRVGVSRE